MVEEGGGGGGGGRHCACGASTTIVIAVSDTNTINSGKTARRDGAVAWGDASECTPGRLGLQVASPSPRISLYACMCICIGESESLSLSAVRADVDVDNTGPSRTVFAKRAAFFVSFAFASTCTVGWILPDIAVIAI